MGSHPVNLMIRFLLELMALLSVGYWGWKSYEGAFQYVFGLGLPILMTIVWGTFAVPDDPVAEAKMELLKSRENGAKISKNYLKKKGIKPNLPAVEKTSYKLY